MPSETTSVLNRRAKSAKSQKGRPHDTEAAKVDKGANTPRHVVTMLCDSSGGHNQETRLAMPPNTFTSVELLFLFGGGPGKMNIHLTHSATKLCQGLAGQLLAQ